MNSQQQSEVTVRASYNRCRLTVVGDKEKVDAFVTQAAGFEPLYPPSAEDLNQGTVQTHPVASQLVFNNIVPLDPALLGKPYDDETEMVERMNWGAKYGALGATGINAGPGKFVYDFMTMEDPPIEFVIAASSRYEHLRFYLSYGDERGHRGRVKFMGGLCGCSKFESMALTNMSGFEDWSSFYYECHYDWVAGMEAKKQ